LVALSVTDNGPGIPGDVLPKIFDSYFTTKAPGQGTGLGLSIVLRLIKEANGGLQVRTKLFQGTTFTVYLPAVSAGA
jgi:signal transduction histidine kinase